MSAVNPNDKLLNTNLKNANSGALDKGAPATEDQELHSKFISEAFKPTESKPANKKTEDETSDILAIASGVGTGLVRFVVSIPRDIGHLLFNPDPEEVKKAQLSGDYSHTGVTFTSSILRSGTQLVKGLGVLAFNPQESLHAIYDHVHQSYTNAGSVKEKSAIATEGVVTALSFVVGFGEVKSATSLSKVAGITREAELIESANLAKNIASRIGSETKLLKGAEVKDLSFLKADALTAKGGTAIGKANFLKDFAGTPQLETAFLPSAAKLETTVAGLKSATVLVQATARSGEVYDLAKVLTEEQEATQALKLKLAGPRNLEMNMVEETLGNVGGGSASSAVKDAQLLSREVKETQLLVKETKAVRQDMADVEASTITGTREVSMRQLAYTAKQYDLAVEAEGLSSELKIAAAAKRYENALAMRALAMTALAMTALAMTALAMTALAMTALAMTALAMTALAMTALAMTALAMTALAMTALAMTALAMTALAMTALAMTEGMMQSRRLSEAEKLTYATYKSAEKLTNPLIEAEALAAGVRTKDSILLGNKINEVHQSVKEIMAAKPMNEEALNKFRTSVQSYNEYIRQNPLTSDRVGEFKISNASVTHFEKTVNDAWKLKTTPGSVASRFEDPVQVRAGKFDGTGVESKQPGLSGRADGLSGGIHAEQNGKLAKSTSDILNDYFFHGGMVMGLTRKRALALALSTYAVTGVYVFGKEAAHQLVRLSGTQANADVAKSTPAEATQTASPAKFTESTSANSTNQHREQLIQSGPAANNNKNIADAIQTIQSPQVNQYGNPQNGQPSNQVFGQSHKDEAALSPAVQALHNAGGTLNPESYVANQAFVEMKKEENKKWILNQLHEHDWFGYNAHIYLKGAENVAEEEKPVVAALSPQARFGNAEPPATPRIINPTFRPNIYAVRDLLGTRNGRLGATNNLAARVSSAALGRNQLNASLQDEQKLLQLYPFLATANGETGIAGGSKSVFNLAQVEGQEHKTMGQALGGGTSTATASNTTNADPDPASVDPALAH